jgi:hypothetical protein
MTTNENPLITKITLPGQRFRMPSRGLFYDDGELAENVIDGEVEVRSMTTLDEIALRTPEFLFSGEAIEKVFNRCIPEIQKPLRLLSQDVDYLLTCLRIVSYGGSINLDLRCPKCEEAQIIDNEEKEEQFKQEIEVKAEEQGVPLELAMMDEKVIKRLDVIRTKMVRKQAVIIDLLGLISNNTVEIDDESFKAYSKMLSNGQLTVLKPLQLDSAVMAFKYQNEDFTEDLTKVEEYVSFLLASRIKKVDDITDLDFIYEWVQKLPVMLKNELNDASADIVEWGTTFDYDTTCEDCEHVRNINTLLNPINFFMTPSESEELNS